MLGGIYNKIAVASYNDYQVTVMVSVPEIASQYNFPISNLPEGTVRERTFINSRNRTSHSRIRVTPHDSDMSVSSDNSDSDSDPGDGPFPLRDNVIPVMHPVPEVGWGGLPPRILQSTLRNRRRNVEHRGRRPERLVRLARVGFTPREEEHDDSDSEHDTESIGSMPELISASDYDNGDFPEGDADDVARDVGEKSLKGCWRLKRPRIASRIA